ncbi:syntaxin 8 [Leptinotarsa decemlineata]|uniref:syntaxin 8 n=1 Tax=Leptinotarsa decemlineata TaxID=7539 RepID=UPI003D30705C
MSLLFLEEDPWLLEYESCEKLHRDVMEQLSLRQKHPRTSEKYNQLSANIRLRLKQFNNEVGQLNQKLEGTSKLGSITPAECERRTRQVEVLQSKGLQMQKIFDEQVVNKLNEDRRSLVGESSMERVPFPSTSVDDLRMNQKKMLGEQDRSLEGLSRIISRQKDIANTISDEVDFQNDILDDLGTQLSRTDDRLNTETRHIEVVDRKDKTCIYWVIIILLFISIVVVAVL